MVDEQAKRVLIMATDGFEDSELFGPLDALKSAGAEVTVASNKPGPIQGVEHDEPTRTITPDGTIDKVSAEGFDALVLPGGALNPDQLRTDKIAVGLVQAFHNAGKPVAAICHAPWLLAEADIIRDRRVTGWPSIRTDLRNAGANVVDEEVVIDGNLITSRKPEDVPAFSRAVIEAIGLEATADA